MEINQTRINKMCTEGVHQQRKNFVLDQEFHVRRRRKPTT